MNPKKIFDIFDSVEKSQWKNLADLKTITEKQAKINEILEVDSIFADAVLQ